MIIWHWKFYPSLERSTYFEYILDLLEMLFVVLIFIIKVQRDHTENH